MLIIYVATGVVLGLVIYNNLITCVEFAVNLVVFAVMLALIAGIVLGFGFIGWLILGDDARFVMKNISWVDLWIIPFIVALAFGYYFAAFGFKKKQPEAISTQE
jgi:hypothetical protein